MEFKKIKKNKVVSFDKKNEEQHLKDFGFKVPEDFFKEVKKDILNQTILKNKKRRFIKIVSLSTSIAAAFVLFFTAVPFKTSSSEIVLNDAESNMMINSLIANEANVNKISDTYMLGALYSDEEILN